MRKRSLIAAVLGALLSAAHAGDEPLTFHGTVIHTPFHDEARKAGLTPTATDTTAPELAPDDDLNTDADDGTSAAIPPSKDPETDHSEKADASAGSGPARGYAQTKAAIAARKADIRKLRQTLIADARARAVGGPVTLDTKNAGGRAPGVN